MFIRVIFFSCFLFVALQACAQVVPFRNDPESLDNAYIDLKELVAVDENQAQLHLFRSISGSDSADRERYQWNLLNYVALLLENDSVTKARSILSDSTAFGWATAPQWVKNLHTVHYASVLFRNGDHIASERMLSTLLATDVQGAIAQISTMKLAEILMRQGKLDLSGIQWYNALERAEQLSDSVQIADSYFGKAGVLMELGWLDEAEKDIEVFRQYNRRTGNRKKQASAMMLSGALNVYKEAYNEALDQLLQSHELQNLLGDMRGQGESLYHLSRAHMGLTNWSQALRYLHRAMECKTISTDIGRITAMYDLLGTCYVELGDEAMARKYFNLAGQKGWKNGQIGQVIRSLQHLIDLDLKHKNWEEVVYQQTRLIQLKDSLSQIERNQAVDELEVRFRTARKEQEIQLLQQQQTIITNRWLTLALSLFLIIVIGILILDNQKRKHRQEKQLLQAKDQLQKAELKMMTDLLEHNQQRLKLYTENLLRKNELVGQLESRLRKAVKAGGKHSEQEQQLVADFSNVRILTEEDWQKFKDLFDSVHHGMLDRLLADYVNLTLAEQRLFLLMKLELSTKQIANILGVSPETVKKGRYRLKLKLALPEHISLQEFIQGY